MCYVASPHWSVSSGVFAVCDDVTACQCLSLPLSTCDAAQWETGRDSPHMSPVVSRWFFMNGKGQWGDLWMEARHEPKRGVAPSLRWWGLFVSPAGTNWFTNSLPLSAKCKNVCMGVFIIINTHWYEAHYTLCKHTICKIELYSRVSCGLPLHNFWKMLLKSFYLLQ